MFDDPQISLMIMLLLCFLGMLVMFLFVIRSLSSQAATLREGFNRQQSTLADMEQQLMDMNFALRRPQKEADSAIGQVRTEQAPIPDDLRELFDSGLGVIPAGNSAMKIDEPVGVSGLDLSTKNYSYPSAAGLDQPDEDLLNISLGMEPGTGSKSGGKGSSGLNLKLDG
jgi:hypothetical protein